MSFSSFEDAIAKIKFTVGMEEEVEFAKKAEAKKKKGGEHFEKIDRNLGRDKRIVMWVSRSIDKGQFSFLLRTKSLLKIRPMACHSSSKVH
jgi:hypothetical protein